jgi:hypothetical protein
VAGYVAYPFYSPAGDVVIKGQFYDDSLIIGLVEATWGDEYNQGYGAPNKRYFIIENDRRFTINFSGWNLLNMEYETYNAFVNRFGVEVGLEVDVPFEWHGSGSRGSGSVGGKVLSVEGWRTCLKEMETSGMIQAGITGPNPWPPINPDDSSGFGT